MHVDPIPSLSGHPIERRFAETNADWQSWAQESIESNPTTQQGFNYADRVTRLLRQELVNGQAAGTRKFWSACVSPLSAEYMMIKSPTFCQSVDWCIGVGPGISLLNGCTHCWIVPTSPNLWYLMNANWNSETNAIGSASNKGYYWRCCHCTHKYERSFRNYRTLLLS